MMKLNKHSKHKVFSHLPLFYNLKQYQNMFQKKMRKPNKLKVIIDIKTK